MPERPPPKWPGPDDKAVVAEMLADPNSSHWSECLEFIRKVVQYANIPPYFKEDVVQNTMLSVIIGLANFRFHCKLTSWLTTVANSRITDISRKHSYESKRILPPNNSSHEDAENETEARQVPDPNTTEELCLINEELREVGKELLPYLMTRLHSERDRHILIMAWFDGLSYEEIAARIGVSAPVVGYVNRSTQSYLRKRIHHQPPPPEAPL